MTDKFLERCLLKRLMTGSKDNTRSVQTIMGADSSDNDSDRLEYKRDLMEK